VSFSLPHRFFYGFTSFFILAIFSGICQTEMHPRERKFIDTKRLSFSQAMQHSEFFLISQQRLHTFLEDCFRLIEDVGLFNNAPNRHKKEIIAPYERKKNEEMQTENEHRNE
jgi:hypothetical protein